MIDYSLNYDCLVWINYMIEFIKDYNKYNNSLNMLSSHFAKTSSALVSSNASFLARVLGVSQV